MNFNIRNPFNLKELQTIRSMYFNTPGRPLVPVTKGIPRVKSTVYPPKEDKKP